MKLYLVLTLVSVSSALRNRRTAHGCEGATLELTCDQGKVINIIRANFGRISSNVCSVGNQDMSSWSTRCIQPTSLRAVTSACRGRRSHCSVEVSSVVFGDPCPGTPKYLEVVYTCQRKSSDEESPSIPEWILQIKSLPQIIPETTTMTPTTRSTVKTTSESLPEYLMTEQIFPDVPRSRFPESLPLMNGHGTEELQTEQIFINQPKSSEPQQNVFEDSRILPAIIVSSVCVFIVGVVGVYLVLHRQDPDTEDQCSQYTIVRLDPGSSVYQSQVYQPLSKGQVCQMSGSYYKSSQSVDQSHYYQIV